ncbi:GNAT family N-acetyltransferase [Methylocystis heyeri]|uniref:GNAT family N-acetyltransferase n=1 Tax=Methylocystis heyeri TaxID=391905 RepID=A0A6B8KC91_9HYPH|nr:GNAT family N-acetyltransferase [Methylocystis heyeri]QGM46034.1 GNAT family N-acetyltransferase [Methylocystis heyeri]
MPKIRPALIDDAPAIASIYGPYVVETAISFEIEPPDAEEIARRIANCMTAYPWLVAECDGKVAGYAYAGRHGARAAYDWSAEVSIYLHPDHCRKGVGRALYRTLFRLLQRQGVHAVFAVITLPNDPSVALHHALGMEEIGVYAQAGFKFGEWRDVLTMGVTISGGEAPLGPVTPFPRLDLLSEDFERA